MESTIANKNNFLSINDVIVLGILVFFSACSYILFLYFYYGYPFAISSVFKITLLLYLAIKIPVIKIPSNQHAIRSLVILGIIYEIIVLFFWIVLVPILATLGG